MRRVYWLLIFAAACGDKTDPMGIDAGLPDSGAIPDLCGESMPCALTAGTMMQEFIGEKEDEDTFTIAVPAAGSVLQISVSNDAEFSPIKLDVTLFSPSNVPVRNERFEGNGKQTIDIQYVAAEAGTYRLRVADVGNDQFDRRNPFFVVFNIFGEADDNEPNNIQAMATPLVQGTGETGVIGAQADEDWFAIDVPANQLVQIMMTASGGDGLVRLNYELFAPDGTTRLAQGFEPEGAMTSLRENRAVGNAAGRYFIRIFDEGNDNADLARIYILTITFVAEPDMHDLAAPNETRPTATNATSGTTYTGFIAAKSDLDFYGIQVNNASMATPKLITVEAMMGNGGPVDLAIVVYKPNGDELVCAEADSCKAFRFVPEGPERPTRLATSHPIFANGRYLVVVKDNQDNDYDVATSYTVRIDVLDDPDVNERYELGPEEGRTIAATTSTAGTTITYPWVEGYISYADDEDWFTFNVPGDMPTPPAGQNGDWLVQLEIEKQGPTPVELQVFFYSSLTQYGGFGQSCREPAPGDPDPTGLACQYPDAENGIMEQTGEAFGECLVVFREHTRAGPHFFRVTDLNRDDFDVRPGAGAYRFRVSLTARCTPASVCAGMYTDVDGSDLCARP